MKKFVLSTIAIVSLFAVRASAQTDDAACDSDSRIGVPCSSGMGACQREGVFICTGGIVHCNASPGTPSREVLGNGIDDDCNGLVDAADPTIPLQMRLDNAISRLERAQCDIQALRYNFLVERELAWQRRRIDIGLGLLAFLIMATVSLWLYRGKRKAELLTNEWFKSWKRSSEREDVLYKKHVELQERYDALMGHREQQGPYRG